VHKQKETNRILATTVMLGIVSMPAVAGTVKEFAYTAELDACVNALTASIEMDGVRKIRHIVTKVIPYAIGYTMTLQTSTYTEDSVRHYSSSCTANGDNPPFRLRIAEELGS
jgi:hypothetical protein